MHGLTCKEIGRYFGTSARAIEMRLYRARRQLKKETLSTMQAEKSDYVVCACQKPEHRLKGTFTFDPLKSIIQEGIKPHQPSTKPSFGELVVEISKNDLTIRKGMGCLVIKNLFLAPDRYFLRSKRIVIGKTTSCSGKANRMSANNRFMMVKRTFSLSPIKA